MRSRLKCALCKSTKNVRLVIVKPARSVFKYNNCYFGARKHSQVVTELRCGKCWRKGFNGRHENLRGN